MKNNYQTWVQSVSSFQSWTALFSDSVFKGKLSAELLSFFFFFFKYRSGRVIRVLSSLNRYPTRIIGFWKKYTWIRLTTGFGFTRWDAGRSDPVGLDGSKNRWTALSTAVDALIIYRGWWHIWQVFEWISHAALAFNLFIER